MTGEDEKEANGMSVRDHIKELSQPMESECKWPNGLHMTYPDVRKQ